MDAKVAGGAGMSGKKYIDIDEALNKARTIFGVNYYIEPAAKEYIQKYKLAKNKNIPKSASSINIKEEGSSKPSYKECLQKGIDPLDGEYIDRKIEEKFEKIGP